MAARHFILHCMQSRTSPSRFSNVAFCLACIAAAAACSRAPDRHLTVGGVRYTFPANEIVAFTEPGEGQPYVRVRVRGKLFDLIYSSRERIRRNWQGAGTPLVTSINDHPSKRFERFESPGFVTVCRGDQPYFSCGMRIEDRGVPWAIVFTNDQLAEAEIVHASAVEALKRYRS
jgi:hypothetical protein